MTENKVVVITPPDKLFNQNTNFLFIYPNSDVRKQLTEILRNATGRQNIYLYDQPDDEQEIDWLLSVANMCDAVILDIDNSSQDVRNLSSYLVSLPQTYWLTQNDTSCYNKLSVNRIYNLNVIENLIGGQIEKEEA